MYKLYEYCKNCGNGSFCVMLLYGCKLSVTCVSIVHARKYVWDVCAKIKKIIKKKKNLGQQQNKSKNKNIKKDISVGKDWLAVALFSPRQILFWFINLYSLIIRGPLLMVNLILNFKFKLKDIYENLGRIPAFLDWTSISVSLISRNESSHQITITIR